MGLDWMLNKYKPKEGFEERLQVVAKLLKEIRASETAVSPQLEAELKEISVSVYEAVGAPQVGFDERANEWFRKKVYEPALKDAKKGYMGPEHAAFWKKPFEECLEAHKGQHVMELAQQEGGVASVTGVAASSLDFRGKVLGYCGLPKELVNESYEEHTAEESLDYAKRLEEAAVKIHNFEHREMVEGAIEWLRFWGSRGFGWYGWY